MKDEEAKNAAHEVAKLNDIGQDIVIDASIRATESMIETLRNSKTKDTKIKALKDHGIYMGVGTQFMETLAPKAERMTDELIEHGASPGEARVNTALWLAKVFIEIQNGMDNYHSSKV